MAQDDILVYEITDNIGDARLCIGRMDNGEQVVWVQHSQIPGCNVILARHLTDRQVEGFKRFLDEAFNQIQRAVDAQTKEKPE